MMSCSFLCRRFDENERGLTFIGPFKRVYIEDCLFSNNVAMHAGAGMLMLTRKVWHRGCEVR